MYCLLLITNKIPILYLANLFLYISHGLIKLLIAHEVHPSGLTYYNHCVFIRFNTIYYRIIMKNNS
jgi:hypothetical protein